MSFSTASEEKQTNKKSTGQIKILAFHLYSMQKCSIIIHSRVAHGNHIHSDNAPSRTEITVHVIDMNLTWPHVELGSILAEVPSTQPHETATRLRNLHSAGQ